MGADKKTNAGESVRAPSGLLQRSQSQVALEAFSESGSSFGAEVIVHETVNERRSRDGEECQWALTQKQTLGRRRTPGW